MKTTKTKWLKVYSILLTIAVLCCLVTITQIPREQSSLGKLVATFTDSAGATVSSDYPITGDADDEFQAALNALPSSGGTLQLVQSGNFTFSATVTRAIDNVVIEGTGKSSYFSHDGSTPIFTAGGTGWVFRGFATDAGGVTRDGNTSFVLGCWIGGTYTDDLYYTKTAYTGDGNISFTGAGNTLAAHLAPVLGVSITGNSSYSTLSGNATYSTLSGNATYSTLSGNATYAGNASQSSGYDIVRTATYVVAASDAPALVKAQADSVCDGTADNVEINAALASLPATGGVVMLTSGTFNTVAAITPPVYSSLIGQGRSATIIALAGYDVDVISSTYDSVRIKDLGITRDGTGATQDGIDLSGSYCVVENVLGNFTNGSQGILLKTGTHGTVKNCRVLGTLANAGISCSQANMLVDGNFVVGSTTIRLGIDIKAARVRVVNNYVSGCSGQYQIGNDINGTDMVVIGNHCYDGATGGADTGIHASAARGTVEGNWIYNAQYYGILASSATSNGQLIDGNRIYTCPVGIGIYRSKYNSVTGNVVDTCSTSGIKIFDDWGSPYSTNNNIVENTVSNSTIGIDNDDNSSANTITNNDVSNGNTTPIRFQAGTSGCIVGPNSGYIAPGEIRTYSGSLTAGANVTYTSIDNPFGQTVRVKSLDIKITTADADAANIDAGIGNSSTTTYTTMFNDLPGETIGYYTSTVATPGTQTVPIEWTTGSGNRYLNIAITDNDGTSIVATYTITVMGN